MVYEKCSRRVDGEMRRYQTRYPASISNFTISPLSEF